MVREEDRRAILFPLSIFPYNQIYMRRKSFNLRRGFIFPSSSNIHPRGEN